MEPTVLIVEDESALVTMLRYNLEKEGFAVIDACDGAEALRRLGEVAVHAVLLDWMLPGLSGLELCRRLRLTPQWKDLPVIIITARGEEQDRIRALDSGADDFVVKPFSPHELAARLRAIIRRVRPAAPTLLRFADVVLDLDAHRVTRGGHAIHLSPTEFRLLRFLMERPSRVFSREQILDAVWGPRAAIDVRTIDVHMRRLRRALNGSGDVDLIRTVREAGYALDREPPPAESGGQGWGPSDFAGPANAT